MLQTLRLDLLGAYVLTPRTSGDARGFFSEVYNAPELRAVGIEDVFVQDNHAYSKDSGVIRGLHFQIPPHAQAKLVRVTAGAILVVLVDIRHGSPSFGRHVAVEISATVATLTVLAVLGGRKYPFLNPRGWPELS